jgi:DNA-binding XRE family transcriptional regulator
MSQASQGRTRKPAKGEGASTEQGVTDGGRIYGNLVSVHRVRLGLTRAELAARVQISPSQLVRIEQGHTPSAELVDKLAAELYPDSQRGPAGRLIEWGARHDWKPTLRGDGKAAPRRDRNPTLRVPKGSRPVRTGIAAVWTGLAALLTGLAAFLTGLVARVARSDWRQKLRVPRGARSIRTALVAPWKRLAAGVAALWRGLAPRLAGLWTGLAALSSGLATRAARSDWRPTLRLPRASRSDWKGLAVSSVLAAVLLVGGFSTRGLGLIGGSSSTNRSTSVTGTALAEFIAPASRPAAPRERARPRARPRAAVRKAAPQSRASAPNGGPPPPTTLVSNPTGSGGSADASPTVVRRPGVSPPSLTGGGGSGSGVPVGAGGSGSGGSGGGGASSPPAPSQGGLGSALQGLLGGGG